MDYFQQINHLKLKRAVGIMKKTVFFLTFCLSSIMANSSYAQNMKLNIKAQRATLESVLKQIEKQSEFLFFYNASKVNKNQEISVSEEDATITEVMNAIASEADVVYTIKDRHIVLSEAEEPPVAISSAQQSGKKVTGTILDASGETIIGANVVEKGTTNGTITDFDGKFTLNVPDNAILLISYIGYSDQEVAVAGKTSFNITLKEDSELLDEVVVVGYGTMKKSDLTGSVAKLSASSMKDLKVSHPTQALAGQIAGVQVQQQSGMPGAGATIRVRGSGSISASSSPLYVVDGFPLADQNLNSVNPSDIESIEILKDASASAIYGSRAANGVVLVTTKSGKAGKVNISLDAYYGIQQVDRTMNVLNAQEFVTLSKEAFNNNYTDRVPGASASDPLSARPSGKRYRYPAFMDDPAAVAALGEGVDWQDEIFNSAPIQNYQLTITGGDEKTKYMFSGGYFNQEGIIVGSDYERFSARAKVDSKLTSFLKMGINLAPTYMNSNTSPQGHWAGDGVVLAALAISPVTPVKNENGVWLSGVEYALAGDGLVAVPNPLACASEIKNNNSNLRLLGNMYAEVSILDNLILRSTLGADIKEYRDNYFRPSSVPKNGGAAPLPSSDRKARETSQEVINWLNENTLTYKGSFGKHELDALLGFTVQKNIYKMNKAEGSDFPNDIIQTINNAKVKTSTSDMNEWSLMSYIGRANYRYDNRYYATASLRIDGSSRFGKNSRYGYFPSGALAWRASQEEFLKDVDWLSDLKVKASVGLTGNNSIPNYGSIGTVALENYVFGAGTGTVVSGAAQSSFSNADLTWEKTLQYDLGVELSVLNNRIGFSFDWYKRLTTDLLLMVDIPTITGFSKAWQNIGAMENMGFEFGINTTNITTQDLTWTTNLNFSTNSNVVTALGPTGDPIRSNGGVGDTHITMIGEPIGNFYGYKQIGVYMNQEDLDNNPKTSSSHVGDVKYEDVNGDGVITPDDRTIIGNNMPTFTWGMTNTLRYKNLDLSIVLQGVHGNEILHLGNRFYGNLECTQNQTTEALNRWQSEENPGNGWVPRANTATTGMNNAVSSRWVEDGSFVRINNITLGYSLPKQWLERCSMQYARIYFSTQNPFTFTNYSGYNPETSFKQDNVLASGTDYGMYPLAKSFTLGINVTF